MVFAVLSPASCVQTRHCSQEDDVDTNVAEQLDRFLLKQLSTSTSNCSWLITSTSNCSRLTKGAHFSRSCSVLLLQPWYDALLGGCRLAEASRSYTQFNLLFWTRLSAAMRSNCMNRSAHRSMAHTWHMGPTRTRRPPQAPQRLKATASVNIASFSPQLAAMYASLLCQPQFAR